MELQLVFTMFRLYLYIITHKQYARCVSLIPLVSFFFLVYYSLTGGIGAAGVAIPGPAASVVGAPAVASLVPPTIPAVGSVPGAPVLPITTQSAVMSTPTEFLLLKNMFDPAVEVFLFWTHLYFCFRCV